MKELKKYIKLPDEDFGRLVKTYFYYMENEDLPNEIDDKTEILFRTTIMKKCDYQITNTKKHREKRKEKKI